MKIILPMAFFDPKDIIRPLFFLAGPTEYCDDWQHRACLLMRERIKSYFGTQFTIVVPKCWSSEHDLYKYQYDKKKCLAGDVIRQSIWERYYLEMAGQDQDGSGCLIFWLPNLDAPNPSTNPDPDISLHVQDLHGKLGEWRGRQMYNLRTRFVAGAEDRFPGLDEIKANFSSATLLIGKSRLNVEFTINTTLEDTIDHAIMQAIVSSK